MFAIGRGSGMARRFESVPVVPPSDISILKTRQENGNQLFQKYLDHYSPSVLAAQSAGGLRWSILAECVRDASLHRHLIAAGAADRQERRGRAWEREVWRSSTLS
jgi:hypothetical protein